MRENVEMSDLYTRLAENVIREHPDLQWIGKADIAVGFMASDKPKKSNGRLVMGECIRVKDLYRSFCPFDFLIVIYEQNTEYLTDEQMKILLYHELLHVGIDESGEEPKYVVRPHDIEDFRSVIARYGLDWAGR